MKTIDEIAKEYETFTIKTTLVDNIVTCRLLLEVAIEDTVYDRKELMKELRLNKWYHLKTQIIDFFFLILKSDVLDVYGEDEKIIKECISFIEEFISLLERMREIICEDNYVELTKIVDFATDHYHAQTHYYDSKRDRLDFRLSGIDYYDPRYEDNRESILQFIKQKIEELSKNKNPQFVKKV